MQQLTSREVELLQLIADHGYDSDALAERLVLSKHTIKSHKCTIYQKMNVNNITDAMVKAIRLNIVKTNASEPLDRQSSIFGRAITLWGQESQMNMLAEECAELIQAVMKHKRFNDERSLLNLHEEFADVEIMMNQIRLMLDPVLLVEAREAKLDRLENLITERLSKNIPGYKEILEGLEENDQDPDNPNFSANMNRAMEFLRKHAPRKEKQYKLEAMMKLGVRPGKVGE